MRHLLVSQRLNIVLDIRVQSLNAFFMLMIKMCTLEHSKKSMALVKRGVVV